MLICSVVGARPNFMKVAPVYHELRGRGVTQILVHTGQHYDATMSDIFLHELQMPRPDVFLGVGSGSHAEQTAGVMTAFERICLEHQPALVIVAGDVNSTLAGALVAAKLQIPIAHIESGLRSFDRAMPEEINRIVTDHLSDFLFTTESSGNENLLKEGISPGSIHLVGNCMIDSLCKHIGSALARAPWQALGLHPGEYGLVTLHRPAAVDNPASLEGFRHALREIAQHLSLVFPVHPRTRQRMDATGLDWQPVHLVAPLGYLDFLGLMAKARVVLTDSGGIQEETTALGVDCITMRDTTERPVTITVGTNRLAGTSPREIVKTAREVLETSPEPKSAPPLWDGMSAGRIADVLQAWMERRR
ncbi:MAG: UDP-N-acetylglucosamine 2-epimerase (non-hydrolyzing) [Actinobacteria bacterium]|nr:UDP-N-acetylglucosamine 2-epimerase (non-hydrolyzing) [Actinomycetota bacterium]